MCWDTVQAVVFLGGVSELGHGPDRSILLGGVSVLGHGPNRGVLGVIDFGHGPSRGVLCQCVGTQPKPWCSWWCQRVGTRTKPRRMEFP